MPESLSGASVSYISKLCGVMVNIIVNGHNEPSSNPGEGCFAFHIAFGKGMNPIISSPTMGKQ